MDIVCLVKRRKFVPGSAHWVGHGVEVREEMGCDFKIKFRLCLRA